MTVSSTFRGVDRADVERQAADEARRAAGDGYAVASQEWGIEAGTPVLAVRYQRVASGAGIDRPTSTPWTAPRLIGLALFLIVFVGWVLLSAR